MKTLSEPEIQVIETIGDFIKFWGFSRHHGRIWALLYLSQEPLASPDIQGLLDISAGLVSMSLKELLRWDVIAKVGVPKDRKDYYSAQTDVWQMITRVMREREYLAIRTSMRDLDDALGDLETREPDENLSGEDLEYLKPRVEALISLSETFSKLLSMILDQTELNLDGLKNSVGNLPD